MNKSDLIDNMANEAKITKTQASAALNAMIDSTSKALSTGDKVILVGFGTFSINKRASRTGRNPQTGQEIKIAAKNVVKFKAGTDLTKKVN